MSFPLKVVMFLFLQLKEEGKEEFVQKLQHQSVDNSEEILNLAAINL